MKLYFKVYVTAQKLNPSGPIYSMPRHIVKNNGIRILKGS